MGLDSPDHCSVGITFPPQEPCEGGNFIPTLQKGEYSGRVIEEPQSHRLEMAEPGILQHRTAGIYNEPQWRPGKGRQVTEGLFEG